MCRIYYSIKSFLDLCYSMLQYCFISPRGPDDLLHRTNQLKLDELSENQKSNSLGSNNLYYTNVNSEVLCDLAASDFTF